MELEFRFALFQSSPMVMLRWCFLNLKLSNDEFHSEAPHYHIITLQCRINANQNTISERVSILIMHAIVLDDLINYAISIII